MNNPSATDAGRRHAPIVWSAIAAACICLIPSAVLAQGADAAKETECADGVDNDGDTVFDCGDADCAADPACQPDGNPESTNSRCSDWVDNDNDGYTDCDDTDCDAPGITVCQGSWSAPVVSVPKDTGSGAVSQPSDEIPELGEGMSVEDLIGKAGDNDGERNDIVCSDGIDNDNDGRVDCADFGCRFDPSVTICQGDPDVRFSVVARAEHLLNFRDDAHRDIDPATGEPEEGIIQDTMISRLQLRAFGPIPLVPDSFYLLSMRAERTPRLTFVIFQVPVGKKGHYVNINSGTGGLSWALVRSAHKRLLLDAPYYLYNAFEQGTGAAIEFGGPLDKQGKLLFRTFASGGTGRFTGNVGGRFVGEDDGYAYTVGGQLHWNIKGYYSRWDSPMLYTPSPTTLALLVGAKYDQRPLERYPAINVSAVLRYQRFIVLFETYNKYVLDFDFWQHAYNIQVGALIIPKRLLLAADFGEYIVPDEPEGFDNAFDQETQWRAAAHVYLWRNVLTGSVLYVDRTENIPGGEAVTRELKFVGQYRF